MGVFILIAFVIWLLRNGIYVPTCCRDFMSQGEEKIRIVVVDYLLSIHLEAVKVLLSTYQVYVYITTSLFDSHARLFPSYQLLALLCLFRLLCRYLGTWMWLSLSHTTPLLRWSHSYSWTLLVWNVWMVLITWLYLSLAPSLSSSWPYHGSSTSLDWLIIKYADRRVTVSSRELCSTSISISHSSSFSFSSRLYRRFR